MNVKIQSAGYAERRRSYSAPQLLKKDFTLGTALMAEEEVQYFLEGGEFAGGSQDGGGTGPRPT